MKLTEKLGQEFVVEPWRWLENARRLSRDDSELPEHHESFIYIAMIRLMLRKLTYNQRTRALVTVL